jgi:hypothetical protein
MNKASNVPPGPSLKGGKNRTRRGGGSIFSSTATVAPNTLNKYPARRKLLPFNNISNKNALESERRDLNAQVVEKIRKITPSTTNNSRVVLEADIETLQQRIDKINELLGETVNNANVKAELNALTKGGKRKSGRTRRSRK